MQTRRFGRTGHMSTVAIFGAVALGNASQAEADIVVEQVMAGASTISMLPRPMGWLSSGSGHGCRGSGTDFSRLQDHRT